MSSLESRAKRMSRNIVLTVTAASAMLYTGCNTRQDECKDGKDSEGQPCVMEQTPGGHVHYVPRSYYYGGGGGYGGSTPSYRSNPSYHGSPSVRATPSTPRGGFGSIGHGFSGGG